MASRWLNGEWVARILLVLLVAGLVMAIVAARQAADAIEIHAVMPEKGGWLPDNLTAEVGVPLKLRLISDDVMHGFAIGQQPWPAVDVKPGQATELALTFDKPGTYTYYCTRWCGPNHWRMRGTIEVADQSDSSPADQPVSPPLYVTLGLDIDAEHEVNVQVERPPSASRGKALDVDLPAQDLIRDLYLSQSPFEAWQMFRAEPTKADLSDADLWDLVAFVWRSQTTPEALQLGQRLYAENCAACHGESGTGNGVMAVSQPTASEPDSFGRELLPPSDITDAQQMLGASSALLQGKIIRGGMGTGMPYWGNIFTDEEVEALVDYLWTFQFPVTKESA